MAQPPPTHVELDFRIWQWILSAVTGIALFIAAIVSKAIHGNNKQIAALLEHVSKIESKVDNTIEREMACSAHMNDTLDRMVERADHNQVLIMDRLDRHAAATAELAVAVSRLGALVQVLMDRKER